MSEAKIITDLKARGYIDEKELFCYSNANITTSTNYIVFMKFSSINQSNLPRFMLLSICKDKLHILKASMMGKPKEYFTSIDLKRMKYIKSFSKDFIDCHEFSIDYGENQFAQFYIQGTYKKDKINRVVNAINDFNKSSVRWAPIY